MSRCALLPFPGDPFLLNYWLKLYKTYWSDEVDALYILHNSSIQPDVEQYIKKISEDVGANYIYVNHQIEHGDGMKRLLDASNEDYIMFIEDDAFIFRSYQVDKCFELVEKGIVDFVASKRGSCSDEISEVAKRKWNLDYSGFGDQGCNFWPCYFFAHRDIFKGTDYNFGARAWNRGEKIKPLDHIVESEVVAGDTFVNMSLQLRAKNLSFHSENHYHGSPDDLEHYRTRYNLWDGKAKWTHVGSLSSGVGGALTLEDGRPLARKNETVPDFKKKAKNDPKTNAERKEWERRVQWWLTFYENRQIGHIEEFAQEYKEAIDRIIANYGLSVNNIRVRQKAYKQLGL